MINILLLFLILQSSAQEKIAVIKVKKKAEEFKTPDFKLKRKTVDRNIIITVPFGFLGSSLKISDLIEEIPDECKELTCSFEINVNRNIKPITLQSNGITVEARALLNLLKPGEKFYIDNLKTDCAKNLKKLYTILVE